MPTSEEVDTIANIYLRVVEEAQVSAEDFERLGALAHRSGFRLQSGNTEFPHLDGARVHIETIMQELVAPPSGGWPTFARGAGIQSRTPET